MIQHIDSTRTPFSTSVLSSAFLVVAAMRVFKLRRHPNASTNRFQQDGRRPSPLLRLRVLSSITVPMIVKMKKKLNKEIVMIVPAET